LRSRNSAVRQEAQVIRLATILVAFGYLRAQAQVAPKHFGSDFSKWSVAGSTNVFSRSADGVTVAWDSSLPNSYFYLPLGLTLTRADDFELTVVFRLDALELGTTPGKPDTFEIAAGLLNLTNARDPQFFRGSGRDLAHGPRNLVELDYFPATDFIAPTVAPTMATASNQILFSDNHPLELQVGSFYKVVLSFTSEDQTLRSRLWQSDSTNFSANATELKPLVLSTNYGDFAVDTLTLINYSDAGQSPPQFSGSLKGSGMFASVEAVVYNRPTMQIQADGAALNLSFDTAAGWQYQVQTESGSGRWQNLGAPITGTDKLAAVSIQANTPFALFRVKAQKM
jgi:hypothetical protein